MATSKPRPSSPLLPAFGIRDLNEPTPSLGVVQISARQYANTVQSQPDAKLSYIDLDDGEVITVGSSFELGQRLDEPISHSAYHGRSPVPAWPAFTNALEETQSKMHIFDIRRSSGSLAVWRDHEAYSSKSLRDHDTSASSVSARSPGPSVPASSASELQSTTRTSPSERSRHDDDLSAALSKLRIACEPTASGKGSDKPTFQAQATEPAQVETPVQMETALNDILTNLQSHLSPLADFLESTADGLRKMAEKTREADTAPVEKVLIGFRNIVTGVGELGIEFLATLDEELEKRRSSNSSDVAKSSSSRPESQLLPPLPVTNPAETKSEGKLQLDTVSAAKKVCFADITPLKVNPVSSEPLPRLGFLPQPPKFGVPSVPAPLLPLGFPPRPDFTVRPPPTCVKPSLMTTFAPPNRLDAAKNSIIDSQLADPDVLTRYPPLPSLRKAASVGGLQARPEPLTGHQRGLSTTSALSRYPSIGQFEEQTRLDSMNHTDQSLVCTSTSGQVYKKAPNGLWKLSPQQPKKTDIYKKPTVEDVEDDVAGEQPTASAIKAAVSVAPAQGPLAKPDDVGTKTHDTFQQTQADWHPSPLPGAWPDTKLEDWYVPCSRATIAKSVTAAPPQHGTSTAGQASSGLSPRISSPVSETYNRAPLFPRKSQTVSGTNPAARLNGPFDPLAHIPVLQPRPQRSQPDLSMPKAASPSTRHPVSASPISSTFPRRSHTVHHTDRYRPRDVAPYPYPKPSLWENYIKNNHSLNTLPIAPSSAHPWSFYPEASKPSSGPSMNVLPNTAPRPPVVPSLRPVQSMGGLRSEAANNSQSLKYRPTLRPLAPRHVEAMHLLETNKARPATVNVISVSSPPAVSAPAPAFVPAAWSPPTASISRTSSILSPCPPPITHPRGRSGISPPAPFASKSVDECVRQLKVMGFGSDPNELSRLNVYAGAAAGEIEVAIEMIEEDREAARELEVASQASQVGSFRDVERDFGTEENPWED